MWFKWIKSLFRTETKFDRLIKFLETNVPDSRYIIDPYWKKYIGCHLVFLKCDFPNHRHQNIGDNIHIEIRVNDAWHVFIFRKEICTDVLTFPDDYDNYRPIT